MDDTVFPPGQPGRYKVTVDQGVELFKSALFLLRTGSRRRNETGIVLLENLK